MPSLFDNFRFTANDGTGDQSLTPIARGLRRRWERIDGGRAYRVKLTNKLLFKGADYTYFRDLYDAGDCTEVTLLIENYCGGEWVTWHEGIIPIYNGDYNASRCEVTFEVKPNDIYECAKKAFEVRSNWLNYATPVTIGSFIGTVESITCSVNGVTPPGPVYIFYYSKGCWGTGFDTSPGPDPATKWRVMSHTQLTFGGLYTCHTTWSRETIDSVGTPPGNGWINIGGTTWVRALNITPPIITYSNDSGQTQAQSFDASIVNQSPVSNGRLLSEILIDVVSEMSCGFDSLISNFFNINPDATNPTNDAYTYASDNFGSLMFFQKSDIVRPSASNDATRFTFSMKEFLEEMKILNVFHSIENIGGVKTLRIEHFTYWSGANGLDLTALDDGKYIEGKDAFKTEDEVPNFESFAWQESFTEAFRYGKITYPELCATKQGDERTATQLCTDLSGLIGNNDAGLEGFFLLSTIDLGGGSYVMNTLYNEANGAFAWYGILPFLWADGRFHPDATANVPDYTVNSVIKRREQPQITIPFCCGDEFEPSELVQSQLGWGEVKSAEEDTERGTLKLSLLQ